MKKFEDFLFIEYDNIAKAHFESQKQLALFFRYYTIFFSVPIVIISFLKDDKLGLLTVPMFGGLLIIVGIIGLSFYWITIDLKHEAVLYARTVNGIRHFFYTDLKNKIREKIQTLPTDINKPPYYNPVNPILLIMMIVNCFYFYLGLHYLKITDVCFNLIIAVAIAGVHFLLNFLLSKKQEKRYLKIK